MRRFCVVGISVRIDDPIDVYGPFRSMEDAEEFAARKRMETQNNSTHRWLAEEMKNG